MRRISIVSALLLSALPLSAHAADSVFDDSASESPWYWGAHYTSISSEPEDLDGGMLFVGWDMNNLLSIEAHIGKSSTKEYTSGGNSASLNLDYTAAAFLRANLRYDKVTWFLLGGYGQAKPVIKINGQVFINEKISGPAYGAGVEIYGSKDAALTLSYIRYVDDSSGDVQGEIKSTNLGFIYHFDWLADSPRY